MSDLCLKPNGWQGRVIPLSRAPVSIGRHPDNMIRIHDDGASRFHCVIESDGHGKYIVRDLGSRNGTKVNSVKTAQAILDPGDTIKVGKHEFIVYERNGEAERPGGPKAPAVTAASPEWARNIKETAEALPPKGVLEESITLVDAGGADSPVLVNGGDGPLGLRLLLQMAFKARATDIHLEPKSMEFNVRMRVDGQMVPIVEMPLAVGALLCGLVKNACQVKTAARDAMLDGHFSVKLEDRRVEFRASFTPSVYGQKLVLRILDERGIPHSIDELDLAPYMKQRVRRICDQDHGLLLVCGPTGSGKTTTLYSCLREIDRETRNVVTIEDPVEYQIDNVTQIPIDEKKGNSFGTLLRSVLRQDPDVILLGEIRDEETARTAMQAAMTGHVVFTTVHAKDTISAVFRLLDLKTEPYLIANALDMVLAQRLVRVLCENCKSEIPFTPGQTTRLGRFTTGRTTQYAATGCGKCLRTGYRGRRAIFELLDFNDELRDVVLREPTIQAMKKVIEAGMFTTLAQSGWRLVAEGTTTLEEVDRVAGQG